MEALCPDSPEWPERWVRLEEDRAYGEEFLYTVRAIAESLVASDFVDKTVRSHLDNPWLVGGEIIRNVYTYSEYAEPPQDKLREAVDDKGGPYYSHSYAGAEEKSIRATCRKLNKILRGI